MTDRSGGRDRSRAAILMLDIVGFSLMMGHDEDETTSRVIRFHDGVEGIVAGRQGRVVDTAGDSVFAVFGTSTDAIECAAEIQRRLASDPRPDRMVVRIGVHLGDVIFEGAKVFGDDVNIAARLQQVAPPGGIAVSEEVHREVEGLLPFDDGGTPSLRNIRQRLRVYTVSGEAFGFPPPEPPRPFLAGGISGFGELADTLAAAVEDRLRSRGLEPSVVERASAPEAPPHPARLVQSKGFWLFLVLGGLLIGGYASGWTSNGVYGLLGSVLVGAGIGRLMASLTGRRGLRTLLVAIGIALGVLFLDGTVSRAIGWALAATLVGPSLAGLRRATPAD